MAAKKPTVYLDTSVVSSLWYEGNDIAMIVVRVHTREWWDLERSHTRVVASPFVEQELAAGHYPRQEDCLKLVRRLRYVPATGDALRLAELCLERGLIPESKPVDALHLAVATVQRVDYLMSWNYAHLANPIVQERLAKICEETNQRAPLLVSPQTIPQVRFGQDPRRGD